MLARLLVALLFSVAGALVCRNGFASLRFGKWMGLKASTVDDKAIVTSYFNNEGFSRWNNIYSASKDVNSVQLDIRSGHQRTVDKVISWMSGYDSSRTTLCDAGCGVGSLSIPASKLFKRVYASDISDSMVKEASKRAKDVGCKNIDFHVSDMEKLTGRYGTVACIDVMIHYPTEQMHGMVAKLGALAEERIILSFAPKTLYYQALKKVGELFPGKSKATRAYLHAESDVVRALDAAGFVVQRTDMTATNFYFSRLIEAVRK